MRRMKFLGREVSRSKQASLPSSGINRGVCRTSVVLSPLSSRVRSPIAPGGCLAGIKLAGSRGRDSARRPRWPRRSRECHGSRSFETPAGDAKFLFNCHEYWSSERTRGGIGFAGRKLYSLASGRRLDRPLRRSCPSPFAKVGVISPHCAAVYPSGKKMW